MAQSIEEWLAGATIYRRLAEEDRRRLARVAQVRNYPRGKLIFAEGDPSTFFITVASGRVKVFKTTSSGKEVILELFGAGDPLGALAAYEGRPFPASAMALDPTTCILLPREAFYALLEQTPSLARGLLAGLTLRLIQLTTRITELSGGQIEPRLARLILKLADDLGRPAASGTLIPLRLKRHELADFVGTTTETAIRLMSRWSKAGMVRTQKEGFLVADRAALERLAANG
jgi:CRP/FNR family transcriptional regulator